MNAIAEPVLVWTGKVTLEGRLAVPAQPAAAAIVVSAPALVDELRDEHLINALHRHGIATLHVSLLTADEVQFDSRTSHYRHDADFLAQRFLEVASWLSRNRALSGLPLAYVASSGAAAGAIVAATQRPDIVSAIVCIDGRTDLAIDTLRVLKTPTLLVVKDMPVLRMNREALMKIRGEKRLEVVHDDADAVVHKSVLWLADKLLLAVDAYGMF